MSRDGGCCGCGPLSQAGEQQGVRYKRSAAGYQYRVEHVRLCRRDTQPDHVLRTKYALAVDGLPLLAAGCSSSDKRKLVLDQKEKKRFYSVQLGRCGYS